MPMLTKMDVSPGATGVTRPALSTRATDGSLLLQRSESRKASRTALVLLQQPGLYFQPPTA